MLPNYNNNDNNNNYERSSMQALGSNKSRMGRSLKAKESSSMLDKLSAISKKQYCRRFMSIGERIQSGQAEGEKRKRKRNRKRKRKRKDNCCSLGEAWDAWVGVWGVWVLFGLLDIAGDERTLDPRAAEVSVSIYIDHQAHFL